MAYTFILSKGVLLLVYMVRISQTKSIRKVSEEKRFATGEKFFGPANQTYHEFTIC